MFSDHIMFINAKETCKKTRKMNLIHKEHKDKIINAYLNRDFIPSFSATIDIDVIKSNGYSLSTGINTNEFINRKRQYFR